MTNSQRFTLAHKIARETVLIVGDYRIAFSIALKETYMNTEKTTAEKLIELGGNEWKKGSHHRIYVYGSITEEFFNNCHASFGKAHKVFFNVNAGKFSSTNEKVAYNLNLMLDGEW